MQELHIDIETHSSVNLLNSGVYAYTQSPDFEVLLFAYAYGHGPVEIIDLAQGETIPPEIIDAIIDPDTLKTAYNAQFERVCLSAHINRQDPGFLPEPYLDPASWKCTAAHAAMAGLAPTLDACAQIMLPEEYHKHAAGRALIRLFCGPCSPTKANGYKERIRPADSPEKWETFKRYCQQDVVAERALEEMLARFPFSPEERALYNLDQRINDRGILLDPQLVYSAIKLDRAYTAELEAEAIRITGIDNPKSAQQIKAWLNVMAEEGAEVIKLTKATLPELLRTAPDATTRRLLEIRQELAKASVKKYEAMARAIGPDNRVRGLLQFYGAGRTGRWSGRLVQVQNLPQNHLPDLAMARDLARRGRREDIEMLFGGLPQVLSELIRTAFIPKPGHRFIVADFSAIEARVIAWLANEKWRLDVFNSHGKIYEASASAMFKIPIEQITKGSPYRQRGKVSELALGFGGGPNALIAMGALDMGIPEEELPKIVRMWRNASPNIVRYWKDVEEAAMETITSRKPQPCRFVTFRMAGRTLTVELPSGRRLAYHNARLENDPRYGRLQIVYDGTGESKKWMKLSTYGGKLTENIVQATARDCLAVALQRLDRAGHAIVMHVHDEAVLETTCEDVEAVCAILGEPIAWAPGLPLTAAGFACDFYQKD